MTTLNVRRPSDTSDSAERDENPVYAAWGELPARVTALAADRSAAETAYQQAYAARVRRADSALQEAITAADHRRRTHQAEADAEVAANRTEAASEFESESARIEAERQNVRRTATARYRRSHDDASTGHDSARWEAGTMLEAAEKGATEWKKDHEARLADEAQAVEVLKAETEFLGKRFGRFAPPIDTSAATPPPEAPSGDPFPALRASIESADRAVLALEALKLANAFRGARMVWVFLLPALLLAYPLWLVLGMPYGLVAAAVAGIGIGIGLNIAIARASRGHVASLIGPLRADLASADALLASARAYIAETYRHRMTEATERRDREWKRAEVARNRAIEDATQKRDEKIGESESNATAHLNEARSRRDARLLQADETEEHRKREIAEAHARETEAARKAHRAALDDAEARRQSDWQRLADAWASGWAEVRETVGAIRAEIDPRFPDLADPAAWSPAPTLPPALRIGEVRLDLDRVPGGISSDERLRSMVPDTLTVPALAEFPEHASLAFEFSGEAGRKATIEAMEAAMLRFLTGLPAGRVRLTMLDPVGLGRSFAGFMHLADFSEALVHNRIWTEPQQIDARLSELNVHVENVIQNNLRNEFATIEAYNEQAAEVAEPYRVLVVPDFPAGFTENTARRLLAIAKSGPRCGVYVVLGIDTSQPVPPSITREELLKPFVRVFYRDERFKLRDPRFEPFPFEADRAPGDDATTALLHRIGEAAREANRVEVPFEVIAPRPEDYWKGDSRSEVVVPLGRAGATKLQALRLGRGTSQHVLIAGRTGSGKSTLLHALVTNSALIYGPDELELYLIDFKKGVEFKTYATHGLPHARVVAIESEREFGLSVLQRLDAELKIRGDLYRDLGVQDVAGFRAAAPDRPMPRILLIVDEFQEFFVEDDKIAQECSLLLDRLVRQGRAFGIHVHLGSQTLGGAYALARSTLGQMAVRIALQCSEADAHLILNEENSAARLLSRPGEAIYNDANGQSEGNHIFQVVLLTDSKREAYLKSLSDLARDRGVKAPPPIVFEGNKPSDITKLPALNGPREPRTGTVRAWLGEAVAIKDPTSVPFRSQGGNNLFILGQNEELAAGVASAILLSLAAQMPQGSRLYVLDGTTDESTFAGHLAGLAGRLPIEAKTGGPREVGALLGEVAAEIEKRQGGSGEFAPIFVMIHDLPRFRDLRKSDDDFSFSRRGEDKPVSPSKLLGTILRDGPALGVHVIVWCDSLNNANRAFDRQSMREFEMRVLFQMSPADSSNLIDSPAASRLGPNRAFFSSEEAGVLEKFRPYGMPSPTFVEELAARWDQAGGLTPPPA